MADLKTGKELSEEERMKQMAAQMRAAEYKGLSEEEIQEKERQKEMRRKKNIEILEDTLGILENGSFEKDGQKIKLVRLIQYSLRNTTPFSAHYFRTPA